MARRPQHAVKIYRASFRISLNSDDSSALRAKLKKNAFEPNGFANDPGAHGTGLWVNPNCSVKQMRDCTRSVWKTADKHSGPGTLDHVWSNFELIDLRSLFAAIQNNEHTDDALSAFLTEMGLN